MLGLAQAPALVALRVCPSLDLLLLRPGQRSSPQPPFTSCFQSHITACVRPSRVRHLCSQDAQMPSSYESVAFLRSSQCGLADFHREGGCCRRGSSGPEFCRTPGLGYRPRTGPGHELGKVAGGRLKQAGTQPPAGKLLACCHLREDADGRERSTRAGEMAKRTHCSAPLGAFC